MYILATSRPLPLDVLPHFALLLQIQTQTFTKSHQKNQPFTHKIFLAMTNSKLFFLNMSNHKLFFIYTTFFVNIIQNMLYMTVLPSPLSSIAWMDIKITCIKKTFGYV